MIIRKYLLFYQKILHIVIWVKSENYFFEKGSALKMQTYSAKQQGKGLIKIDPLKKFSALLLYEMFSNFEAASGCKIDF